MALNDSKTLEMKQNWNKRAKAYTNRIEKLMSSTGQQQWGRRLQTILGSHPGIAVLDVGTGPGFLALQLASLGHRVVGLDLSEEMLRTLKPGGQVVIWDGDWMARNMLPFAQLQLTEEARMPRRFGIIRRQGAINKGQKASSLLEQVTSDLKAAGFIQIRSCEKRDNPLSVSGNLAKLHCEGFIIVARKP